LSVCLYQARSVTDEPARHYELPMRVHGRNRMARRERNELLNPAVKKNIVTDEQRPGSCLDEIHERGVDLAVGAHFQYLYFYPDDRGRRLAVSSHYLGFRTARILKSADPRNDGYQLVQLRDPLGPEFNDDLVEAFQVAARSIEAGNEAELHRVSADTEHNWDA